MKVKHKFSKDATALLLGCLCLLGTSLQAQFGGGGLEQAKPPYRLSPFGTLITRSSESTPFPGDKTRAIFSNKLITQQWYSPTYSKRNFIVYRKTQTEINATIGIIKGKPVGNILKNGKPVENVKINKQSTTQETCYRRADGRHFWVEESSGPARQGNNRSDAPPEMPDYIGTVSEKRTVQVTIPTPKGPIKQRGLLQVTSTSTRSVEVFNDSKQPIDLELILCFTHRHVPSPPDQYEPAQWMPQPSALLSKPFTIPVGASTTLKMSLPQGWSAGKILPEEARNPQSVW